MRRENHKDLTFRFIMFSQILFPTVMISRIVTFFGLANASIMEIIVYSSILMYSIARVRSSNPITPCAKSIAINCKKNLINEI
jgi:hypothetical protein